MALPGTCLPWQNRADSSSHLLLIHEYFLVGQAVEKRAIEGRRVFLGHSCKTKPSGPLPRTDIEFDTVMEVLVMTVSIRSRPLDGGDTVCLVVMAKKHTSTFLARFYQGKRAIWAYGQAVEKRAIRAYDASRDLFALPGGPSCGDTVVYQEEVVSGGGAVQWPGPKYPPDTVLVYQVEVVSGGCATDNEPS